MQICFIGGGNMASALIAGMLAKDFTADQIVVADISADTRNRLETDFKIRTFDDMNQAVVDCDVIVLAVKPQQLKSVVSSLQPALSQQLLISVAAGIRAEDLARWSHTQNVVRAMPNTPSLIQAGMTGLYALPQVSDERRQTAEHILNAVGQTLWLQDEGMIDCLTAISGSGPAYVFYMIEALQKAAEGFGFSPEEARLLSESTFLGASKLAAASDENAGQLRERVTSKNGTTYAGLCALAERNVADHIGAAANAAAERSREMAEELGQQ